MRFGVYLVLDFFLMIGCWNIRELNDPLTQSEIRRFLKEHHLTFVGILETRVKEHNPILVEEKLANGWLWVTNYTKSPNGRIWIGWDPECWTVGVIGESDQCIHCKVTNLAEKWDGCISVAYGLNCYEGKRALWRDLRRWSSLDVPWLVLGDFNAVVRRSERSGGALRWPSWKEDFAECLLDAELSDLKFISQFFIWSNRRDSEPITRKLDRVLVNKCWEDHFAAVEATFHPLECQIIPL